MILPQPRPQHFEKQKLLCNSENLQREREREKAVERERMGKRERGEGGWIKGILMVFRRN